MGKSIKGKELGKGISQRKDGVYQARFTDSQGKRITVYGKTYKEVTQKLRDAMYQNEKETHPVSAEMTLDEWFVVWLTTYKKNCRGNTQYNYLMTYKKIKESLGCRKLSQLNLLTLQEAFNNLNSDSCRKAVKVVLVDMLDKAVESELIPNHYARKINTKITNDKKREKRILSEKEIELFLNTSKGKGFEHYFVVALETGMRVSELNGLKWEDIDFDNQYLSIKRSLCYYKAPEDQKRSLHFHSGKTDNSIRIIPLTQKCISALQSQPAIDQLKDRLYGRNTGEFQGLVFTTRENRPAAPIVIYHAINRVIDKINENNPENSWKHFGPHTFRHTFATRAIEKGMRPKTVQMILGHANVQTTMNLYCHLTEDALFEEMKKMDNTD